MQIPRINVNKSIGYDLIAEIDSAILMSRRSLPVCHLQLSMCPNLGNVLRMQFFLVIS